MSGPTPMSLGGHVFEALGFSFNGLTRDLDTKPAEIEVAQAFDVLQFTGPKSDDVTIKGVLFPEAHGGTDTLEALRNDAIKGKSMMLVTMAGRIRGKHVVVSIHEDRSLVRADGLERRNAYTIKLKRDSRSSTGAGLLQALGGGIVSAALGAVGGLVPNASALSSVASIVMPAVGAGQLGSVAGNLAATSARDVVARVTG